LLNAFGWRSIFWVLLALVIALLTWLKSLPRLTVATAIAHPRRGETTPKLQRDFLLWRRRAELRRIFFLHRQRPSFLIDLLGVSSYGFAWLFIPMIGGVMIGALVSGRAAGKLTAGRTIGVGYLLMFAGATIQMAVAWYVAPVVQWHVLPIMIYTMGSSIVMPSATLLLLDCFDHARHGGVVAGIRPFRARGGQRRHDHRFSPSRSRGSPRNGGIHGAERRALGSLSAAPRVGAPKVQFWRSS
jgi:DHA1 family bicyclomycin/chloramphenicol resistance-like MFS transporter